MKIIFIIALLFTSVGNAEETLTQEVTILPGSSALIETEERDILVKCKGDQEEQPKGVVCDCRHFAGFIDGQVSGTVESNFQKMCDDRFPFTSAVNCRAL